MEIIKNLRKRSIKKKGKELVKLLIGVIFLVLFSCNDNVFYSEKIKIKNNIWKYEDTLQFKVNITDTSQLYDLFFTVVNSNEYPNNNLWLFISAEFQKKNMMKDTLEFILSDNKGKWYGKKSYKQYSSVHYFKKHVIFPKRGTYLFDIRQGMRHLELKGINEFGLMIKRSGKK